MSRPSPGAVASSPGKVNLFEYQSTAYNKEVEAMYAEMIEQMTMGLRAAGGENLPPNIDKALLSALKALLGSFDDAFGWGAGKERFRRFRRRLSRRPADPR